MGLFIMMMEVESFLMVGQLGKLIMEDGEEVQMKLQIQNELSNFLL